jgi:hypothetical protein
MKKPTRYTQTPRRDRINWLSAFESHAIAAKPELAGRIDWDSAIFFFKRAALLFRRRGRGIGDGKIGLSLFF